MIKYIYLLVFYVLFYMGLFSNVRSNPNSDLSNVHTALTPVRFSNNSIRQEANLSSNPSLGDLTTGIVILVLTSVLIIFFFAVFLHYRLIRKLPDYPSVAVVDDVNSASNQIKRMKRPVTRNNLNNTVSSFETHQVNISTDPAILLNINDYKKQVENKLFNDNSVYLNDESQTNSTSLSITNQIDSTSIFSIEPFQNESVRCDQTSTLTANQNKTQTQL